MVLKHVHLQFAITLLDFLNFQDWNQLFLHIDKEKMKDQQPIILQIMDISIYYEGNPNPNPKTSSLIQANPRSDCLSCFLFHPLLSQECNISIYLNYIFLYNLQMTNISNLNLSKGTIPPLLKYKIVFLGDQAVGKSSIINRFIYDIFDGNQHRPTIGIDFISQNIFLEDKTIRLQLWDTAGQERFKALIPNYIRDTSVAIIVYDVTNRSSYKSVQKWIDDVKNQRGEGVIIALLANKVDLEERDITEIEGRELAERNGINFKEVSAKTGANIQEFFKEIAAQLPDVNEPTNRQKMGESSVMNVTKTEPLKPPSSQNIVLTNPKESSARAQTKGCC